MASSLAKNACLPTPDPNPPGLVFIRLQTSASDRPGSRGGLGRLGTSPELPALEPLYHTLGISCAGYACHFEGPVGIDSDDYFHHLPLGTLERYHRKLDNRKHTCSTPIVSLYRPQQGSTTERFSENDGPPVRSVFEGTPKRIPTTARDKTIVL